VIGTLAGSYRIVDTISVGGMGTVYRAEHTLLGRPAAVKVLNPEMSTSRDIINRFFNEARATTSIKHPGIIEVFDFGYLESGNAYLVMEFLEGAPMSTRNRARGRISEFEAAAILRLVCSALTAAHAKGIVHRDLKPDNIFLVPDPDSQLGERPKLLDFGIAKLTDIGLAGTATKTGAVMGTPTYMSPEQCRGTGDVDHRADLYSIGCIFYELVTGRPPFIDRGAGELIGAHLYMQPEPPSRHTQNLSPEAEALIMALLSKNPAERPQSAAELAQRLGAIAARGGLASSVSWDGNGMRNSMPYVAAQPGDATRYPTPAHTPMPTPGSMPMRAHTGPVPTPMGMPTPMGGHAGPMPTPMGGHAGPMPTPMGGHAGPMPTPMRAPATTTDPTTLSGAASQVSTRGGSGKRILAIAGAAVLAGGIAVVVAMSVRGGGEPKAAQPTASQPAATEPMKAEPSQPPAVEATKPAQPAAATATTEPAKPTTEAAKPGTTEAAKPGTTEAAKPATEAAKPGTTEAAKPATEAAKPPTEAAKPATEAAKPATEAAKPPTEAAKPATEAAKPTNTATKPAKPATTKPAKPTKPAKSDNPLLEQDI
jgi:serine/threonine-protein kinase